MASRPSAHDEAERRIADANRRALQMVLAPHAAHDRAERRALADMHRLEIAFAHWELSEVPADERHTANLPAWSKSSWRLPADVLWHFARGWIFLSRHRTWIDELDEWLFHGASTALESETLIQLKTWANIFSLQRPDSAEPAWIKEQFLPVFVRHTLQTAFYFYELAVDEAEDSVRHLGLDQPRAIRRRVTRNDTLRAFYLKKCSDANKSPRIEDFDWTWAKEVASLFRQGANRKGWPPDKLSRVDAAWIYRLLHYDRELARGAKNARGADRATLNKPEY